MKKEKIKLLPIEQFPRSLEISQISSEKPIKYVFLAKTHVIEKERVLEVTFFSIEDSVAEFRVFFNTNSFITEKIYPGRKWSNAIIKNLIGWYYINACVGISSKTDMVVSKFFNSNKSPMKAMENFQDNKRKEELKEKHNNIKVKIDKRMEAIKPLPKDFVKWLNDVALKNSRYIYYKRNKKVINGYCTVCNKDVLLEKSKHNEVSKCPKCKKKVIFKAVGKSKKIIDSNIVSYIQKVQDGIVIRKFKVYKKYLDNYRDPEITYFEEERHFLNNMGQCEVYVYNNFLNTNECRWCQGEKVYGLYSKEYRSTLYTKNLSRALNNTAYKYSQIDKYSKTMFFFYVEQYLKRYFECPYIEDLLKLGLWRLLSYVISTPYILNVKHKTTLVKDLGITMDYLKLLIEVNGHHEDLKLIQKVINNNDVLTRDMRNWIYNNQAYYRVDKIMKYTEVKKIINYVSKQIKTLSDKQSNEIFILWCDYLENIERLDFNLLKDKQIIFPDNIQKAHDEVVKLVEVEKNREYIELVQLRFKELSGYIFKSKSLIIRPPKSLEEIIEEGNKLSHCVATNYIAKYAKGETDLFFIRSAERPNTPFYTLELNGGKVVQVQGKSHTQATDEVKYFVDMWKKQNVFTAN